MTARRTRRGRYRWRTRLRGKLPSRIGPRIGKGQRDCGQHEWYLESLDPVVYRCYHCEVGVANSDPGHPMDRLVSYSQALRSHTIYLAAVLRSSGTFDDAPAYGREVQDRFRQEICSALAELPGGPEFDEPRLLEWANQRWGSPPEDGR